MITSGCSSWARGFPTTGRRWCGGTRRHLDRAGGDRPELALRYLTPHSKWSIHSEYQDNLHMLTLFRGGAVLWLSREDAETLSIGDNDWVEATTETASWRAERPCRTASPRASA